MVRIVNDKEKMRFVFFKAESKLSLNMPISRTSKMSMDEFFGRNDFNFENIEVRDFIGRLLPKEKTILYILLDEEYSLHFVGTSMEAVIADGREVLKKRAYDYYGKEYLKKYENKRI